jgi:tetratricopeptide (TPR) repeat protein
VLLYASDDLDAALPHLGETLRLAKLIDNRTMRCASAATLSQIHVLRGEYALAKDSALEALAVAEEIGNLNVYPSAAAIALIAFTELGEPVDPTHYVDCIDKGLNAAGFMQLNVRFVVDALLAIGDVERAVQIAETLYDVAGGRLRQAQVGVAVGDALQRVGRLDRAQEAYAGAREQAIAIGARSTLVGALLGLAEVAFLRGDTPDAADVTLTQRLVAELSLGRYAERLARIMAPPELARASS